MKMEQKAAMDEMTGLYNTGDVGMAFRYGGDEMLVLIPGGTKLSAEKMIKTWNQAAADRNMYACKHADKKKED